MLAQSVKAHSLSARWDRENYRSTHNHSSHPESENIPARFECRGREEALEVWGISSGPPKRSEGPKTRGKPGVKAIWVLLQAEALGSNLRFRLGLSFLGSPTNDPD